MSKEDAAQLSESLLSPEAGGVGAETRLAHGAGDDSPRLLGMKKRTAYAVLGSAAVLLVTGVTLAIIYGRPPSWKETESLSNPDVDGGSVGISGDGSIIAYKLRMSGEVGYNPGIPSLHEVVSLRDMNNSSGGGGGGGGVGGGSLLSGGFTTKPKFYKYEKAEVLLDNSIYPGGPPPDFAGHLYHYHVVKYNGEDDASDDDAVCVLRYEGKKSQEMYIYLEEFPQHEGIFEGIETDESGAGTVGS
ncbi:hypothetical protein THAOC_17897 [Thalassiosira oceanica]|uniref:Uncharacterized protein n=1 Tax=Thalassiosira oceanica TaxID=159749 RepID=K0S9J6_THAOC|nr:hypothetical protein THAOC_17897 [Thalassiosira oceanica]|eukprot:EJK61589.1 hypothetical protein THAOC_17897 [Thalassiosira oceanica]